MGAEVVIPERRGSIALSTLNGPAAPVGDGSWMGIYPERALYCGPGPPVWIRGRGRPGGVFVDQALLGDCGCEGGGWRGEDFWMVWTVVQRKGCISGHLSLLLWTVVFMVEFNQ